jgi:hypothetical protein
MTNEMRSVGRWSAHQSLLFACSGTTRLTQVRVVGSVEKTAWINFGGLRQKANPSKAVGDSHKHDPVHCIPHGRIDMLIGIGIAESADRRSGRD